MNPPNVICDGRHIFAMREYACALYLTTEKGALQLRARVINVSMGGFGYAAHRIEFSLN